MKSKPFYKMGSHVQAIHDKEDREEAWDLPLISSSFNLGNSRLPERSSRHLCKTISYVLYNMDFS